ncbi:UNVERIFIED_CONTAM: hypothetical protein Scaly_1079000 [Sesamum calycinum]|uniref:Protein arginine methyltransferase NDUFAF7 n=1 Tax=Sesamum calycinum TaxID=2727403 RepID=A0AAW2QL33_9LAMI
MKHLDAIYKQSDISWFTPVELFKPWYAHGIAEAIMRTANLSVPLKVLSCRNNNGSRIYCSSVEISSSLAKKQLETVAAVDSHLAKFRVECRDAADANGWGLEQQPCWVIMLEVLDNLPHDLIYSKDQVSRWMEVWVEKKHDGSALSELYKPLEDPLIASCMEILNLAKDGTTVGSIAGSVAKSISAKVFPRPRRCWLPTGCLKLLKVLHGALPKMSLIATDFSYLPDVRIPGERAPLVASKKDGNSSDHSSYLDAKVYFLSLSLSFVASIRLFVRTSYLTDAHPFCKCNDTIQGLQLPFQLNVDLKLMRTVTFYYKNHLTDLMLNQVAMKSTFVG